MFALYILSFPGGSGSKESASNAGDPGLRPESGKFPGERNDSPQQYSCLENPMDRGAWQARVHGIAEAETTEGLTLYILEELHVFITCFTKTQF